MNDDSVGVSTSAASNPSWERATLEKLVFATLKEQRAARRWRQFSRLVWLALLGAVVWFVYKDQAGAAGAKHASHRCD